MWNDRRRGDAKKRKGKRKKKKLSLNVKAYNKCFGIEKRFFYPFFYNIRKYTDTPVGFLSKNMMGKCQYVYTCTQYSKYEVLLANKKLRFIIDFGRAFFCLYIY